MIFLAIECFRSKEHDLGYDLIIVFAKLRASQFTFLDNSVGNPEVQLLFSGLKRDGQRLSNQISSDALEFS